MFRSTAVLFVVACSCSCSCSSKTAAPPVPTGSGSGPAAAPLDAATVAPPLASCIDPLSSDVDSVVVTLAAVDFCSGDNGKARSCWHVDIAAKHVDPRPVTAKPEEMPHPRSASRNEDGSVAICSQPSRCTTLKPPFTVDETDLLAAAADGSVLIRAADGKPIEIYDVATWKRRGQIRGWATAMGNPARFVDVSFAGPNIIAWADASPVSAVGRIFTPGGKIVGTVGDKDFSQDPADSWPANDTTWLFKQLDDTKLIAVDVATGMHIASYDLASLAAVTNDEHVMAAAAAASSEMIVFLGKAGVVGVVSRATGTVDVLTPPRC